MSFKKMCLIGIAVVAFGAMMLATSHFVPAQETGVQKLPQQLERDLGIGRGEQDQAPNEGYQRSYRNDERYRDEQRQDPDERDQRSYRDEQRYREDQQGYGRGDERRNEAPMPDRDERYRGEDRSRDDDRYDDERDSGSRR